MCTDMMQSECESFQLKCIVIWFRNWGERDRSSHSIEGNGWPTTRRDPKIFPRGQTEKCGHRSSKEQLHQLLLKFMLFYFLVTPFSVGSQRDVIKNMGMFKSISIMKHDICYWKKFPGTVVVSD